MLSKKSLNDVVGLIYMTIEISVSKIECKNSIGSLLSVARRFIM
jgi:hypothetical protein